MLYRIWALTKKELKALFSSPLSYVIAGIFSVLIGILFFNLMMLGNQQQQLAMTQLVLRPIFANINTIFIFMIPVITMRLIAEEKKLGTIQLLYSSPLSSWEIVLGKYFASGIYILFLLSLTLIYPVILHFSGYQAWTVVMTGYLGTFINALAYLAIGLFMSSLSNNQMVACLLGFFGIFFFVTFSWFANTVENHLMAQLFNYIAITTHFEPFGRGVMKLHDFIYYFSFMGVFLMMTNKSLEARNW